ncbi:MAG: ribokinase [Verrucomicrobiota bacterium]|jgi:ribokinase
MIIVLGSLNLDLVVDVVSFPRPGETVPGSNLRHLPGGKGANQALALARMDSPVAMIGAVGDDPAGHQMIADLQRAGVDTSGIRVRESVATGTAVILLEGTGQNQIVVAAAANGTLAAEEMNRGTLRLAEARALVVQLEIPLPAVVAAIHAAAAAGVPVFLNAAPAQELPDNTLADTDWIIVNESEAAVLAGSEIESGASPSRLASRLRERSDGACVAITLGAAGVWVDSDEFLGHLPGFRVAVVDTVGAGDAFVGAFVSRLTAGDPVYEAAVFGTAAGALAVTRPGAQSGLPTAREVREFLRDHTASSPSQP